MRKRLAAALTAALILCLFAAAQRSRAFVTRLRVGFNRYQAPYHFLDERGEAAGLHIDMLDYMAGRLNYELEYIPMETGSQLAAALENGEIDLMLELTPKYSDIEWSSDPLSEEIVCTLINTSAPDEPRAAAAVFQLGTITPAVSSRFNAAYSFAVSSQEAALEYLVSGKADILIGLKESILYHLKDLPNSERYAIENNYVGMVSFAIRVQSNDYSLLQTLNREIASMRSSGAYSEIRQRWVWKDRDSRLLRLVPYLIGALALAIVAIGLYFVFSAYLRRKLQRQVDEKTRELQAANRKIQQHLEQLESESEIRNRIIRKSHLGMVLFDGRYRVKLANDSALSLSGVRAFPGDVRQAEVFGDITRACGEDALFQERPPGEEGARTIRLRRGDRDCQYRYSFQQLRQPGQARDVLLAVEDITDEETSRHAAFEEEKSKILNQVVAGIAHEIKNPLMAIKNFVELLMDNEADPAFKADFIRFVPAEVERINRLVEGLIGYARPIRGTVEPIDLTALVQEAAFFAENSYSQPGITFRSALSPGHRITGNRDQIKQVLINIILNGIESMREKLALTPDRAPLALTITLDGQGGSSVITIRDEGMGMTQNEIERCMDPFFTTKKVGTGLGLTLSRQYTQENNGRLEIESRPGEFTQIKITFGREAA